MMGSVPPLLSIGTEYALPTVPMGKDDVVVVIINWAMIVRLNCFV